MSSRNSALVPFIMEHQDNIYRLAYSYVHNKDDALDVVQESIYKAMKTKSPLQDSSAIKSWFYRIVVHTALDLLKKRKRVQPIEDEQLHAIMDESEDHYSDVDMTRSLEQLPDKYRIVVVLRYFEDLKIEEVAEVLHENVNTVKTRLYHALRLLRIEMSQPS
ncbi:RNA polymerase sigma factor [Paenibacillus terricola]|uniref:RNA polymerase sigma factor n=1 Tax=Paenibacillus terricola TaxID=2763503 RepID=UPI0029655C78|nr:sigma-70 family RNA polymerase sigma factor [Paenibacillus terricola]